MRMESEWSVLHTEREREGGKKEQDLVHEKKIWWKEDKGPKTNKNGKKVREVGEEGAFVTGRGGWLRGWVFIRERAREGRNGVSCSRLLHSYSFFLHISDKQWAFRIVLCEKMKKKKSIMKWSQGYRALTEWQIKDYRVQTCPNTTLFHKEKKNPTTTRFYSYYGLCHLIAS